ncbi:hypothetical protein Tco_0309885 [Tanacetum coccineum]
MLVQPTQDEGASSERLSDEQPSPSPAPTSESPISHLPSPRPSPRPLPTPIVPDSIPKPTGENLGDHSSNDTSLSGNEDDMTLQNVYDLYISLWGISEQLHSLYLLQRFPREELLKENIGVTKSLWSKTRRRWKRRIIKKMVDEDKGGLMKLGLVPEDVVSMTSLRVMKKKNWLGKIQEKWEATRRHELREDRILALRSFKSKKAEQFTIEERAKFLMIQIAVRENSVAQQRLEARNRPANQESIKK